MSLDKNIVKSLIEDIQKNIPSIKVGADVSVAPTGIDLLDTILGGGVAIGKIITLVGAPSGGKSTLAVNIMSSILSRYEDAIGVYIDVEQGMAISRLKKLGCPEDRTILISENITIESVISTIISLFEFKDKHNLVDVPFVVIWDSESATLSQKQLEAQDMTKTIGYKARLLSIEIPKLLNRLTEFNVTLIVISQLRNKIDIMYTSKGGDLRGLGDKTITGGNIMKFMPFQLIHIKPFKELDDSLYGFPGSISEVKAIKNRLFPPLIKIPLVLDYLHGYSDFWTKVELMRNSKAIDGKSWKYLVTNKDKKFHMRDIKQLYDTDEAFKQDFDSLYEKTKKELLSFLDDNQEADTDGNI